MPAGTSYRLYCAALAPYCDRPSLLKGAFDRGWSVDEAKHQFALLVAGGIPAFKDKRRKAETRTRVLTVESLQRIESRVCFHALLVIAGARMTDEAREYHRSRLAEIGDKGID